jgi:hypothetical protein
MNDPSVLKDYQSRFIRLTEEHWKHILDHPEMEGQAGRIQETLLNPDIVIATFQDERVHAYHRFYDQTPVTRKYMIVCVKLLEEDAFIVTAFYSNRLKKGKIVWQP